MNNSQKIKLFFNEIAPTYDLMNNLISFGYHHSWNNHLLKSLSPSDTLLDLCSGTGQISIKFLKKNIEGQAILMDFSEKMLEIASIKGRKFLNRMSFIKGDVHTLPLPSCSIPFIALSYGLRNLVHPERFFQETYRVLRNGGRLGILELTKPTKWTRSHMLYVKLATQLLGRITKQEKAYKHLNDSIQIFPEQDIVSNNLLKTGFKISILRTFFYGTATLWVVTKPSI